MPTISGSLQAIIKGIGSGLDNIPVLIRTTISGQEDLEGYILGGYAPVILEFFLDAGQYTSATDGAWADIVDYYLPIDTAQTYFIVDGVTVSGTFTPITISGVTASGTAYRMSYDPTDGFASFGGPTLFAVHVENILGLVADESYQLAFGYKVDFENLHNRYIDFGYQNRVVVRALVENLASCTKETGEAYWFETKAPEQRDLCCYIKGTYIDGLRAEIYPKSTAYFYGETYRLVVRAKDFAGNEMEPFILVYTIEES